MKALSPAFGAVLLLMGASISLAQPYEVGTVLKWEMKAYSQSAHIIRNQVVYSVKVGSITYQIARRSSRVEMTVGQRIQCRPAGAQMFLETAKGKEIKFAIVGSESNAEPN